MPPLLCRRCQVPVEACAESYDVFERMHYVCFHYEFEHRGDPDVECDAGGCPSSGPGMAPSWVRVSGVDLVQAANTLVPALLALEACGYRVSQEDELFVARLGDARFAAEDPVSLLGLVRLAELRRPWRADDRQIDEVMARFRW